MKKEIFENVLQKDEEIVCAEGVNKKSFIIKEALKTIAIFAVAGIFIAQAVTIALGIANFGDLSDGSNFFKYWPIAWVSVLFIGVIVGFLKATLASNNTFFAITNKRIIKRSGAFSNKFIHYSLNNVGTVEVFGSIVDSKGSNGSANLIITTKDFHTNTDGNTTPTKLVIKSLNNAYKIYNVLSEKVYGNNEVLRVKTEK